MEIIEVNMSPPIPTVVWHCDEDCWYPIRLNGPKINHITIHVCDPKRRREAVEKWMKAGEVEKRWGPMCPNMYRIDPKEYYDSERIEKYSKSGNCYTARQ